MPCLHKGRRTLLPVRPLSLERVQKLGVRLRRILLFLLALRLRSLLLLFALRLAKSALCVDVLLVIVYFLLLITWRRTVGERVCVEKKLESVALGTRFPHRHYRRRPLDAIWFYPCDR